MSEIDDLVAVYGRIDDAVQHDPDLLPKVAAMLPPYRYGAAGWYRSLQDWQQAEETPQLVNPRDLGTALDNLRNAAESAPDTPSDTDYEAWATRHWLNGRRMLASTTLGRIQGYLGLSGDAEPQALLTGIAADPAGDGSGPQQLHNHLRRAADYPNIEAWPKMMADARSRGLVADAYVNSTYIPPIASDAGSFRVVRSSSGTSVALRTFLHADDLELAEAKRCLDPAIWSLYRPPWCEMVLLENLPPDTARYREVISSDCQNGGRLSTILDFRTSQPLPDGGGILEYRIPEGRQDQLVSIDEGSLEVRPARPGGKGISFVSTKRVQFAPLKTMPAMPAAALGFLVWALGWDTLAERFIYFLAKHDPPSIPTDPAAQAPQDPALLQDWTTSGGMMALFDLSIAQLQSSLRGYVGSVRSSMNRAASGNYGMTDYLSDLTKLSNDVTSNTTALASLGAQIYGSLADPGVPDAGGGGSPPPGQPDGPQPTRPPSSGSSNRAAGPGPSKPQ